MIKNAKSIAEYAIRKWLDEQRFAMEHFELTMDGSCAILADKNGDSLKLVYDGSQKLVYIVEE